MMIADGKVKTVMLHDASSERKDANKLLEHMLQALETMERDHKVTVIGFTTDSSGESLKARKLLKQLRPDLIVLPCYAHQVNLVVGVYFKSGAPFLKYADQADELITWLRSKTYVLALLRDTQVKDNPDRTPLSVIRAVLTRWIAHYLAYTRLLELRPSLQHMVDDDDYRGTSQLVDPKLKRTAKAKAQQMVNLIRDNLFWHSLARIKNHLEPLAMAANITQADNARLDSVLLTFALLYHHFDTLSDPSEASVRTAVTETIDDRWMKADQDVFIAAIILHPDYMTKPFRKDPSAGIFFSPVNVYTLMARLYHRFFREPPPRSLLDEVRDYLEHRGRYSGFAALFAQLEEQSFYDIAEVCEI
ncbi:hypothetical protein K474DRAFT_1182193 [Panus rudis PR-1116 ss-1]|nr:hypothetical protein K474DRAFT_1182193 [Panus rudis PR-1116 ss-1]